MEDADADPPGEAEDHGLGQRFAARSTHASVGEKHSQRCRRRNTSREVKSCCSRNRVPHCGNLLTGVDELSAGSRVALSRLPHAFADEFLE